MSCYHGLETGISHHHTALICRNLASSSATTLKEPHNYVRDLESGDGRIGAVFNLSTSCQFQ